MTLQEAELPPEGSVLIQCQLPMASSFVRDNAEVGSEVRLVSGAICSSLSGLLAEQAGPSRNRNAVLKDNFPPPPLPLPHSSLRQDLSSKAGTSHNPSIISTNAYLQISSTFREDSRVSLQHTKR